MRDVLTSRSEDQQGFGLRGDWFMGRCREKDIADRFSSSRTAWLSGLEHAVSCLSQYLCEMANLGAFPTAFDPFEGNKQAVGLLLLCPHCLALSSVKKTGGMVFQVVENSKKRLARPSSLSV
jgi:hypothetical protein